MDMSAVYRHIIMSHGKHTYQKYKRLCCTPRDSVSTNHEPRFSLVIRQNFCRADLSVTICRSDLSADKSPRVNSALAEKPPLISHKPAANRKNSSWVVYSYTHCCIQRRRGYRQQVSDQHRRVVRRQMFLGSARPLHLVVSDRHHVVSFRRPELHHEVRLVDVRRQQDQPHVFGGPHQH